MANLQTILVPINKFTLTQAIAWVKHHSYKYEKVDIKSKYYRFIQKTPNPNREYYSHKLKNGIVFVFYE